MVQRIQKNATIAVSTTYEGESARQITAGIFYVCTRTICGAAPVWSVNAPTALVVVDNGSAAPSFFAAIQTNYSVMSTTGKNCLAGNNSTQQATDAHETGFASLIEHTSEILFWACDSEEMKEIFHEMFLDALTSGDEHELRTHKQLSDLVWCYRHVNQMLDLIEKTEQHRDYLHRVKYPEQYKEKAEKTVVFPAQLTTV